MAGLLVLDFDSETCRETVDATSSVSIQQPGPDTWPADLIIRLVAIKEDGVEAIAICESPQARQESVRSRLGAATADARVTVTPRATGGCLVGVRADFEPSSGRVQMSAWVFTHAIRDSEPGLGGQESAGSAPSEVSGLVISTCRTCRKSCLNA
jgi:hypothetical protein